MRLSPGVERRAREILSLSERVSVRRHQSVPDEQSSRDIAGDPELTEDQGDRDGQEGKLDVRVVAPLHSNVDRRFRL